MGEIRIVGPGKTRGYPYPCVQETKLLYTDRRIYTEKFSLV